MSSESLLPLLAALVKLGPSLFLIAFHPLVGEARRRYRPVRNQSSGYFTTNSLIMSSELLLAPFVL
jgi:hypothetical protein